MGFLASIKKKPKRQNQQQDGRRDDDGSGIKSSSGSKTSRPPVPSGSSSSSSKKKSKWSPLRKGPGSATNLISPSPNGSTILQQLNVMPASGDIEVMTPETKRALTEQREAIRRKLFGGGAGTTTSVASGSVSAASETSSIEAIMLRSGSTTTTPRSILRSSSTPHGGGGGGGVRSIWRTPSTPTRNHNNDRRKNSTALTADKASLPLSAVSLSAGSNGSWEVALQPEDLQAQPSALPSVVEQDDGAAVLANARKAALGPPPSNMLRTASAPRQREITRTTYSIEDDSFGNQTSRVSRASSQPVSVDISYDDTTTTGTTSTTGGGGGADTTTTTTTGGTSLELETSIEATPQRVIVSSQPARTGAAALISPEQRSVSGALYRDKSALKPPAGAPAGSYDEFDDFVAGHQRQLRQEAAASAANAATTTTTTTPTRTSSSSNSNSKPLSPPFASGGDDSFLLPDTVTPVVTNKKVNPALFGGGSAAKSNNNLAATAAHKLAAPSLEPATKTAAGSGSETTDQQSESLGSTTRTNTRGTTSQGGGGGNGDPATITTTGTESASFTTADSFATGRQLVGSAGHAARDLLNAALQCSPVRLGEQVDKHADLVCRGLQSKDSYASSSSVVSSVLAARQQQQQRKTAAAAAAPTRPVYLDEETALRFIRRVTHNGFILLYLQPPKSEEDDWHGRTITMTINKGESESTESGTVFRPPQLEWMTVAGGQAVESTTTTVNLMDVLDIFTNLDDLVVDDDDAAAEDTNTKIPLADEDDLCVFTITTGDGDVHMFEAAHTEERDRIVSGLKTVIARLSFHLVVGDTTAVAELFRSNDHSGAASSSFLDEPQPDNQDRTKLRHPSRTMDQLAHTLLDETCSV